MPTICHFRIPTQDLGRAVYNTIPLIGKSSYKVANHVNNRSSIFSIVAYAWDTDKNQSVNDHPTEEMIKAAMESLDHVSITSATGKGYINIKKHVKQEGIGTRILSNLGGGYFPYAIGGIKAIMAYNNIVNTPPAEAEEFYFSITAHETSTTRCDFQGGATLGQIASWVNAYGWPKPNSLTKAASYAKSKVESYGEIKDFFKLFSNK